MAQDTGFKFTVAVKVGINTGIRIPIKWENQFLEAVIPTTTQGEDREVTIVTVAVSVKTRIKDDKRVQDPLDVTQAG